MSNGPEFEQMSRPQQRERNWLPLVIASGVVVVAVVVIALMSRGNQTPKMAPANAPLDAYVPYLQVGRLAMSESANLAGGKVTYIDGAIANLGDKTVTGITVQVLFRNAMNEVAQNELQSMMFIRTRDPYVDLQPVSASPLKPMDGHSFRLSFDGVTPNWNGVMPELRILHVETK